MPVVNGARLLWLGMGRTRAGRRARRGRIPALVALGGGIGAAARHGLTLWGPAEPTAFPWTTLAINTLGCAVIGFFLGSLAARGRDRPLLRPFLATGVLGGFTTFSAYALDVHLLLQAGRLLPGTAYLLLTPLIAVAAAGAGEQAARRLAGVPRPGAAPVPKPAAEPSTG